MFFIHGDIFRTIFDAILKNLTRINFLREIFPFIAFVAWKKSFEKSYQKSYKKSYENSHEKKFVACSKLLNLECLFFRH